MSAGALVEAFHLLYVAAYLGLILTPLWRVSVAMQLVMYASWIAFGICPLTQLSCWLDGRPYQPIFSWPVSVASALVLASAQIACAYAREHP